MKLLFTKVILSVKRKNIYIQESTTAIHAVYKYHRRRMRIRCGCFCPKILSETGVFDKIENRQNRLE